MASLSDKDQGIVDFYLKDSAQNDPQTYKILAGRTPEQVLAWAKNEPDFSDVAAHAHGAKPQSFGTKLGQEVKSAGQYAEAVLGNTNKMLSNIPGIEGVKNVYNDLGGSAMKAYNGAADMIGGNAGQFMRDASALPEAVTHTDELGVFAAALAPIVHNINFPEFSSTPKPVNTGPQGLVDQIREPKPAPQKPFVPELTSKLSPGNTEAMQFAQDNGYLKPIHYGEEAKALASSIEKGSGRYVDNLYNKAKDLSATGMPGADDLIDPKKGLAALQPFLEKQDLLPEIFQDPAIKKMVKSLAPEPELEASKYKSSSVLDTASKVINDKANPEEAYDWASQGNPDLPVPREVVALGERLNRIARTSTNPAVRSAAKNTTIGLYQDLEDQASEHISNAAKAAREGFADHINTYQHPTYEAMIAASPEEAHTVIKNIADVRALRNASPEALAMLRQSEGYDLASRMYNSKSPIQAFEKYYTANNAKMDSLFGKEGVSKLYDTAGRLTQQRAMIENSVKDYEAAVKAKDTEDLFSKNIADEIAKAPATGSSNKLENAIIKGKKHAAGAVGGIAGSLAAHSLGLGPLGEVIGGSAGAGLGELLKQQILEGK